MCLFFQKKKQTYGTSFLEKMACEMSQNDEIFNKTFTEFESRRGVVVFLLNIVLNIQELGVKLFCHCENVTDFCDFCKVFKKYKNIQYLIYENSLKFNFLERQKERCTFNLLFD